MTSSESSTPKAMGYFWAKDYGRAYQALIQETFTAPNDPELIIGLAMTLEKLRRYSECANQWKNLRRLAPHLYQDPIKLRHASALIELGDLDAARQLLKDIDELAVDQGEKWDLIEKIRVRTAQPENDPTKVDPEDGQEDIAYGDREIRSAGEIISTNTRLAEEYSELIKNTGKNLSQLKFESLILVTYGRTGSTLLQGILNTIDGLIMLGENDNAFFHLFEYLETIRRLVKLQGTNTPSAPFYGAGLLSAEQAESSVKDTIKGFFDPFRNDDTVKCVGFKEVKFVDNPDALIEYLEFLSDMFPQPAFVFIWRDHDEVLNSGWWKLVDRIQATEILEIFEERSRIFAEHRTNCFEINFKDLHPEAERLQKLFAFVGADFDEQRVSQIIKIPHSYDPENSKIRRLFQEAKQ